MKGTLHKTEQGWVVKHPVATNFQHTYYHINPYHEKSYFLDEGSEVEFEIEDFWETGMEEVFKVAKLVKSLNKEGWDMIFETIEKDLHNELPNRVKNYLRNVYKVPEKTNVPYISDDFQIGPDGAYENIEISERDVEILSDAIVNPPEPNENLKKAVKVVYPELEGTIALCNDKVWDDIYHDYSAEQYPAFGGPFTDSISFIDWLKQNYKSPERK